MTGSPAAPIIVVPATAETPAHLKCPFCGEVDNFREVDAGVRINMFRTAEFEGGKLIYVGWDEDTNVFFEHEQYQCGKCIEQVYFPDGVEHSSE